MTRHISLEVFFRKPERTSVRLSPSGRWLAWTAPYAPRLNVYLRDLNGEGEAVRVTTATERDVMGYVWANDERIVSGQDKAGDENHRLYAVGSVCVRASASSGGGTPSCTSPRPGTAICGVC